MNFVLIIVYELKICLVFSGVESMSFYSLMIVIYMFNTILLLGQAIEMLSDTSKTIPIIFLITDGAVEDERHICDVMKSHLTKGRTICPRVYTFGIGM